MAASLLVHNRAALYSYKGLAKNTNHLYMLFALSNLYLCRQQLAN